jgi:hypothetical protein
MPKYRVAHIHEQGQDVILFPLEAKFDLLTDSDKEEELRFLKFQANTAGLRGAAVAVWDAGGGRMGFMAPQQWHPYLRSITLQFVMAHLNKEISWSPVLFHSSRIGRRDDVPTFRYVANAIANTCHIFSSSVFSPPPDCPHWPA